MLQTAQAPPRTKGRVMIVDDEPAMGRILVKSLQADGYEAVSFTDPLAALASLADDRPDLILTDVRMPRLTGNQLLARVREQYPQIPILVMTAYGTVEDAVEMLKAGAYSYITKPFEHANLLNQIEIALNDRAPAGPLVIEGSASTPAAEARAIIGGSPAIQAVRDMILKAADTDSVVLITGESGVGKELVAREIHRRGSRRAHRFVAVNCPAIPPTLIESELFGYERGAFTGAERAKPGLIELSGDGTLFLDEIGELPLELRAKLLRVIQEREVQRLGGLKPVPVNLRILAATNRDLEKEIEAHRFRPDLYYRLRVIHIVVPPLRERAEDIAPLVESFLDRAGRRTRRPGLKVSDEVLELLQRHAWPGNIRELENAVERIVALSGSTLLDLEDIPADLHALLTRPAEPEAEPRRAEMPFTWPQDFKEARDLFERSYLRQLLQQAGGSMAQAARLSGISRRHLYQKLEKLGIVKGTLRDDGDSQAESLD